MAFRRSAVRPRSAPPIRTLRRRRNVRAARLFLSALLIAIPYPAVAGIDGPAVANFFAADLNIFSPDGKQLLGHAQYTFSPSDGTELLRGDSKDLDGEHDIELERLEPGSSGQAPRLIGYEHAFFNADGSPKRVNNLDVRSGTGSCKTYVNGKLEERRSNLTVPADTYAGAAQMLFVEVRLRQGAKHIEFHSFSCIPGPKIVAAEASVEKGRVRWSMYPGKLVKVKLQPDFGWFNFLVAPLVHGGYAWFDPSDNWNYVGGLYDRFYGGPSILTVRAKRASLAEH